MTRRSPRPAYQLLLASLAAFVSLPGGVAAQQPATPLVWGFNESGHLGDGPQVRRAAPMQIAGISGLRSAAAGWLEVVAQRNDGSVWVWGYPPILDQFTGPALLPTQVSGLSGVTAVATSSAHTLVLLADGTVRAWGSNFDGELGDGTREIRTTYVQVAGLTNVIAVSAGTSFSLALKGDGTVWAWGVNDRGQLGDGTTERRVTPARVGELSNVTAICANDGFALVLRGDGTVWAWGINSDGRLGDGTREQRLTPVQAVGLANVIAVAAGWWNSFALRNDGTVWAWGTWWSGMLGQPDWELEWTDQLAPEQVPGLAGVVGISATFGHVLARKGDGTVWAWGSNAMGECGDASYAGTLSTPSQVTGIPTAAGIAALSDASIAFATDGSTWAWGGDTKGHLASGRVLHNASPAPISGVTDVLDMKLNLNGILAFRADGTVTGWGSVPMPNADSIPGSPPVQLAGLAGVATIALGGDHHVALLHDGTVRTWGSNWSGQLGDGTTDPRSGTVPVIGLTGVVGIAAGSSHSLAVKDDGTLWSWGQNDRGQLGDGTTENRSTPVRVSGLAGVRAVITAPRDPVLYAVNSNFALLDDGTVWAWGENSTGALGDGTMTNRPTPVRVPGLPAITALHAGGANSHYVLAADGTVWAWGSNERGQLGDGTTERRLTPVQVSGLGGITALAMADSATCFALTAEGALWTWGDNLSGQVGEGVPRTLTTPVRVTGLPSVTSVAAGWGHAIAVAGDGQVWSFGGNGLGQLGNGSTSSPNAVAPAPVPGLTGVRAVFVWGDTSAALAVCAASCSASVPTSGEPMEVLRFSATATMTSGCVIGPTWDWDFGDGSPHSSEQEPDHWYESEGTFHWTLTVTSDGQTCTREGDVTIALPCSVACSATVPVFVQTGAAASFVATATPSHCASPVTINWDFGDGSDHAVAQSTTHAYAAPGVYGWTLTAIADGASCIRSGVITVLGPSCAGAYDLVIPAAAHSNNAWQSDIDLYNVGSIPASVDIALLKPGQANLSPAAMNVAVLPGKTLRIPDILGTYLPAANAALGIRFCSGSALVNSRFYNIGTAKSGTFGAIVPALPPSAAITPTTRGVFHHLTYSPDPKSGHRVNLGFANASPFSVSVTVRLYGDDGSLIGTKTLSVRAYEQSRLDKIHQTLGTAAVTHGAMTVEVNTPNAQLHAYALLIDNLSGDPAFMGADLVPR